MPGWFNNRMDHLAIFYPYYEITGRHILYSTIQYTSLGEEVTILKPSGKVHHWRLIQTKSSTPGWSKNKKNLWRILGNMNFAALLVSYWLRDSFRR
jgi:hypothetical protein